jgi:hypothetical protein
VSKKAKPVAIRGRRRTDTDQQKQVPVYIQCKEILADYAEQTEEEFIQAGDETWQPGASIYSFNTASSWRQLEWMESTLESEVRVPLRHRQWDVAFLHLVCLTMTLKHNENWYWDQEDTDGVNRFMASLGKVWTSVLSHSDEELDLVNLRWEGEIPENAVSAREKIEAMLSDFKREIVDAGVQMTGEKIYRFVWSW